MTPVPEQPKAAGWDRASLTSVSSDADGQLLRKPWYGSRVPTHTDGKESVSACVPFSDQWRVVSTLRERAGRPRAADCSPGHISHVHSPCLNGLAALRGRRGGSLPSSS